MVFCGKIVVFCGKNVVFCGKNVVFCGKKLCMSKLYKKHIYSILQLSTIGLHIFLRFK